MEAECRKHIVDLHRFIESWMKGEIEKSREKFGYFENELDEHFVIIHPSGRSQSKLEMINDFWGAHGVQAQKFKIEIRSVKLRRSVENMCILNYEEWQTGSEIAARISTVIFKKSRESHKFKWMHLHETWCVPFNGESA